MVWQSVLRHATKKIIHKIKMDQLNFIRIKAFCSVKGTILRMKRQETYCKKYLEITYFTKDSV